MTEYEMLHNQVLAEETVNINKTISVLCDERPGFEIEQARRVIEHLRENGYLVKEIGVDDFFEINLYRIGFLLIIPHASSLPAICSERLRDFLDCGGSVLTFGGVLFGKYVEKVDGKWTEIPLPDNIFDAVHTGDGTKAKAERIVIEGIVPTYKTYRCNDAFSFESDSFYTDAKVKTDTPLRVVCPVARNYGGGYNMGFRNRYIPITKIMGKSDRGDGSEGAAAFIMLSDTMGHNAVGTSLVYPGTVAYTALGSVAANIGIMAQNLMDIEGVPELILSVVKNLCRGLHIFNAGADKYVYSKGEKAVFGAKVHNATVEYEFVTVNISVEKQGKTVYEFSEEIMCTPLCYAECSFECDNFDADEYIVKTELIHNGEIVDKVSQEIHLREVVDAKNLDDFVSVDGENFKLNGKLWYPAGINYWPLYAPGFERPHYWLSWLDKTNYIPEEIEKDLALMSKMGINCLFIRIDGDMIGRQKSTFEDFLWRLRRHNIKLCFSFCNITAPLHYNGRAFRKIMEEFSLTNDPVIFSHDISWESDGAILSTCCKRRYDEAWLNWIIDRYGSIENAEKDFGVKIDRRADGHITVPEEEQFANDGEWRIKICAYRRFMEDYFGKLWQYTVNDMRKADPNHLISYRRGPMGAHAKGVKVAIKHTDYNSHEAYHIGLGEDDYHSACVNAAMFKWLSKNKPTVWAEYGLTLTGMNRTKDFVWDHETERPMAFRMKMTEDYNRQMQKVFERTKAKGTAPWWWSGGLRMVEMSDCGYCGPDGILRPFGRDYGDFIKEYFTQEEKKSLSQHKVLVDLDSDARGVDGLCRGRLIEEDRKAEKENKVLELYTEATDTTSANTPLTAIGNVAFNGSNPPKNLNGEFNFVRIIDEKGNVTEVTNGDTVLVPKGDVYIEAGLGNLKEATWLSPQKHSGIDGCVYVVSHSSSDIKVKIPINRDTPYLEDTVCNKSLLATMNDGEIFVAVRMSADKRADFGEIFRFTLKTK